MAAPRPLALSALAARTIERPPPRRFLFDDDFATPEEQARLRAKLAEAAPEPEVIVPSFTAAELAEARAEGVAEGRALGEAEARASIEARNAAALETIAARLAEAKREAAGAAERAAAALAAATLGLVARALPEIAAAEAGEACARLAESLLARLATAERIAIRLPPELARALAPRLEAAAAAADFTGRLEVIATEGMAAGAMRISWPGGEALRDPAALAAAATEVLRRLGFAAGTDQAEENGDGD
jgi:flagellar biosynthesis/type III secretory pathway protein FliH